jgi:hypothetical protein
MYFTSFYRKYLVITFQPSYKYQHYLSKYGQVGNHDSGLKEEQRPRVVENMVLRAFGNQQEDGGKKMRNYTIYT